VLDFPHVGGKVGRPKQRPDELYADAGYDSEATRWLLRWLGIEPKINKRGAPTAAAWGKSLGGGADHQLVEGAAADAHPLRPPGRHPGGLEYAGGQCDLLPYLES
jgi:hypothetical protein